LIESVWLVEVCELGEGVFTLVLWIMESGTRGDICSSRSEIMVDRLAENWR